MLQIVSTSSQSPGGPTGAGVGLLVFWTVGLTVGLTVGGLGVGLRSWIGCRTTLALATHHAAHAGRRRRRRRRRRHAGRRRGRRTRRIHQVTTSTTRGKSKRLVHGRRQEEESSNGSGSKLHGEQVMDRMWCWSRWRNCATICNRSQPKSGDSSTCKEGINGRHWRWHIVIGDSLSRSWACVAIVAIPRNFLISISNE